MTEENISAIRARLKFKNIDDFSRGYARYISSGGIFIPMSKDRLKPVGALIRFQFLLSDGTTALLGEGRVHQVRANASSGKAPVGMLVKFTKLSQTSKKLVETIVRAKKGGAEASEEEDTPEEVDAPSQTTSEEVTSEGPGPEEIEAQAQQEEEARENKPSFIPPPDVFGSDQGHSSLEEETRAGPSPNDVTPTKHLEAENQPSPPPKADDAPTRDGEHIRETSEHPAIMPPENPFEARSDSSPSSPHAPELTLSSDDPPTREVQADDAQSTPTTEQEDPYTIDLFGDLELGLSGPLSSQPSAAPDPESMPSLFDDDASQAPESSQDEPVSQETPEQDEEEDAPIAQPEVADEQDQPEQEEEAPQDTLTSDDALVSDLVDASLDSLDVAKADDSLKPDDAEEELPLDASLFEEESEPSAPEEEDDAAEVEPAASQLDPVEDVSEETNEVESEQLVEPSEVEALAAQAESEPQVDEEAPEEPPAASPARSINAIKLPPPPTLKAPPAMPDLPGAEDVDLDLIFGDDDDLLGDIMRPGLTATAKPLTIPDPVAPPAANLEDEESDPFDAIQESLEQELVSEPVLPDEEESVEEQDVALPESFEDEDSDAIDLFDIVAPAASDDIPNLKAHAPSNTSAPSPRQLAQTEGGLQVLAYDESTTSDHGLEALSVADDAEEIDLMFDGIFGGGGGESEDDIFGDMFNTQSLSAISQADELPELSEPIEDEPSKELSNLLDNLESDEDEAVGIEDLDLQGASFAEEDKPSEEDEEESLAALLESARQDIDKIQQHKQEEEGEDPGDALLANLLGDEALEAPAEEQAMALPPIPEPRKKEKKGLFSKLFGKDE